MANKLICIPFLALFLISFAYAEMANSSNYSVEKFTLGAVGEVMAGDIFQARFLATAFGPSSRGAISGLHTVNIGFFEETDYTQTVSIHSYSISPKTTFVGSEISLFIFALNAQSVWANIVSPTGQVHVVELVNGGVVNFLPPLVAGRHNITFYANSSTGAIASVIDYFELIEEPIPSPSPSWGGGSRINITEEENCTLIWYCAPWSVCTNGKKTRECTLIGTCDEENNTGWITEETICSISLFDISLRLYNLNYSLNNPLTFDVELIEKLTNESIDVYIKYSIIDENGYEIFSQIETKTVERNLSYTKTIDFLILPDAEYLLRIDIFYGDLQRAFAEQKLFIKTETSEKSDYISFFFFVISILLSIIIILLLKRRKRRR